MKKLTAENYYREYYQNNKDRINANQNARRARKSAEDPEYWRKLRGLNTPRIYNKTGIKIPVSSAYHQEYNLKQFGLSLVQYNEMLAAQNYCCAICKKHRLENKRNLSVDHDHDTNTLRELLCYHCNIGLGFFQDNVTTLRAAANYVEHHRKLSASLPLSTDAPLTQQGASTMAFGTS